MAEMGHLGLSMAISDEMVVEGWGKRSAGERIAEHRRRLLVAQGRIRKTEEGEVSTTASGQIVMPLAQAG